MHEGTRLKISFELSSPDQGQTERQKETQCDHLFPFTRKTLVNAQSRAKETKTIAFHLWLFRLSSGAKHVKALMYVSSPSVHLMYTQ